MSAAPQWDEADLVALQSDLLRFARIQTGNAETAEDLAQETLLAALRHRGQFQGRAQLKTWLFAILKNKINDYLRHKQRHSSVFAETPAEMELDELYEAQFDSSGHWHADGIPVHQRSPSRIWKTASSKTCSKPASTACPKTPPAYSCCAKSWAGTRPTSKATAASAPPTTTP